jgi:signal transduction histidine kinase
VAAWLARHVAHALIVALAGAATAEMAFDAEVDRRIQVPLSLFWALPLLLRRRFPLGAPLFALAALVAGVAADPAGHNNAETPLFCLLAVTVSLGVLRDRRQALGGLVTVLAAVAYVISAFPDSARSDYFWVSAFVSSAWLAGFFLARRTHEADDLRERAETAERERERRAKVAVEEERQRISRELHDVIAHTVSVMVVQTGAVRRLLRPEQERERESLLVVEEIGREALTEMRRLLGILREPEEEGALSPQPSLERVDALVQQVREAGLPVDLQIEGEAEPLPPGVDLCAFRIVQEALTNTLKHAGPARADVRVRYGHDDVDIEVVDNGRGMNGGTNGGGQGLLGMKERALLCGGTFETGVGPEGGFAVRARLPIHGSAT